MTIFNLIDNYPFSIVISIIAITMLAYYYDAYRISKNQNEYSEEYRMFCLFLQTNPDRFSRQTVIDLLGKAKVYNFKYGHFPKSKRPKLEQLLQDHR